MNDEASEINLVMNYFAMVDQCQNLGRQGYSGTMTLKGMALIEEKIKKTLSDVLAINLFNELERLYFPHRNE